MEQDAAWSPSRDELAEIDRIAADPNAHVARLRQERAVRIAELRRTINGPTWREFADDLQRLVRTWWPRRHR